MTKNDMSEEQRRIRHVLGSALQRAGWDLGGTEVLFDGGITDLKPELQAEYKHGSTSMTLGWSVEQDEIILRLDDAETPSHLFRVPSAKKELRVVEVLISGQNELTTRSFGAVIRALADIAGTVFWESSMGTIPLRPVS